MNLRMFLSIVSTDTLHTQYKGACDALTDNIALKGIAQYTPHISTHHTSISTHHTSVHTTLASVHTTPQYTPH